MSPVESSLAARRSRLSEEKREMLGRRLRDARELVRREGTISRRSPAGNAPLSFAQQRLWFLDQLQPGSPFYNLPAALRLRGDLNREALAGSLSRVIERHEALRTCFVAEEGNPVQVVQPNRTVELPLKDLGALPESDREAGLQEALSGEARRPFDLSCDIPVRAVLIRLGNADHVLLVTMHHIVSDAWSVEVFFRELATFYNIACGVHTEPPPELRIQYADYAAWQRQWMRGEVMERQTAYWRKQLAGVPDVLNLPTDRPRPAIQTFRGGHASRRLNGALSDEAKRVGLSEGTTLFMTLLTVFNVLLHRYTKQPNFVVGSPIAGRNHLETEALIGFFANTLAFHTDLSGDPTFRELLSRVRTVTLDAYAHQDLHFDRLVEELQPPRNSGYTPLVQVMFALQEEPARNMEMNGLSISPVAVDTGTSKFDAVLTIEDQGDGLLAEAEYNADLFDPATVSRMLGHFETLLGALVTHPESRISEAPILTQKERQQILVEWNDTATDYPRNRTIPQLFEEFAEATPDNVALVFQESRLSYLRLDERANQLAHFLREQGVGPDVRVAVFMERSLEVIVALLGILKAGGAYVSLDPAHPKDRIATMLQDIQTPVVLTLARLKGSLGEAVGMATGDGSPSPMVVCLDTSRDDITRQGTHKPAAEVSADNLAYVSFTSGSTGRPKGVCIPHRGVVRLVRNTGYAQFGADQVFLQLAPIAFDASTFEIWGALLNGAPLVIFPPFTPTLAELGEFIESNRITTLWLTAGLFHQMADEQLHRLGHVRQLLAGGDVLSVPHVAKALEALKDCKLINGYGPTENTTFTCCHTVAPPRPNDRSIPIGRPIANTWVYVLDERLNPVPIGVPGELYAGGDGLAHGYLNRPDLTSEKFPTASIGAEPGERLYRTGDLVRWLPDGTLEFLGRADLQVKIRGFRVELGEIEAVLGEHPAIRECVVIARTTGTGEKQLVAYYTCQLHGAPAGELLRQHMRRKLPEPMVPGVFVPVESLPLTANGKVDRDALPAPDLQRRPMEQSTTGPRDNIERELVEIWEEVLGTPSVGVHDSFFELGGHSLLAVRLIARIENAFGIRMPLATVFQSPTIAQLAECLREGKGQRPRSSIVEIQPKGSKPPLFLVHGVGGGMFWGYTNISRLLGSDQPVFAFNSRGMDGLEEFETIEEIAAQYVTDLKAFQPRGPYYLGGYCFGGNVAYEMARLLLAEGQTVAMLALMNCTPPNSSYGRIRWTPVFCFRFLKNLWYFFNYLLHLEPRLRRDFFRWKARILKKRLRRLFQRAAAAAPGEDVDDAVDLSSQPEERRKLWEVHVRALMNHRPEPYAGHITLFRTPGHQFLCSYDPQYGWGEFAGGGVTVKVVSGAHESILEEPYVRVVAEELAKCLRHARRVEP